MAAYGRFNPKNPAKYAGDPSKIFFRSSWEVSMMKFLDNSAAVLKWASEEIKIPYLKPYIDEKTGRPGMKPANYFPDFVVVYKDKDGNIQREILEVKPLKESLAEKATTDRDKLALAVNVMKWKAADAFATKHGMKFRVITELSLFKQAAPKVKAPKKPRKSVSTNKGQK